MAIKGKGKTKPRQVARAPRHTPVPVPVPVVRRRWVQVIAAFVAGMLTVGLAVWVISQMGGEDEEALATQRRQAMETWQAEVEGQFGTVGQLRPPAAPFLAPQLQAALEALSAGEDSPVLADDLGAVADALESAAVELEEYELADLIRDKGFGVGSEALFTGRNEMVGVLRIYGTAIDLTLAALDAKPDTRDAIVTSTQDLLTSADVLLADAWRKYILAVGGAGVPVAPAPEEGLPLDLP